MGFSIDQFTHYDKSLSELSLFTILFMILKKNSKFYLKKKANTVI